VKKSAIITPKSKTIFKKGDIGLLIAQQTTDNLPMAMAMSCCDKDAYQIEGLNMPQLGNVVYIDTVTDDKLLDARLLDIVSHSKTDTSKKFNLVKGNEVQQFIDNSDERGLNTRLHFGFSEVVSIIEYSKNIDSVFVMLDSLMIDPCDAEEMSFDYILEMGRKMKAKGKTLVIVCTYYHSHTAYLGKNMDFVINMTHDIPKSGYYRSKVHVSKLVFNQLEAFSNPGVEYFVQLDI